MSDTLQVGVGLTTLPHSCVYCLKILEPQTPETAFSGPAMDCFAFYFTWRPTKELLLPDS
jgi:hypothetical protein